MSKRKLKSGLKPYVKQFNENGDLLNPILKPVVKELSESQKEVIKARKESFKLWEENNRVAIKKAISMANEKASEKVPKPKSKTKKVIKSKIVYEKGKVYKSTKKYTPKTKSL